MTKKEFERLKVIGKGGFKTTYITLSISGLKFFDSTHEDLIRMSVERRDLFIGIYGIIIPNVDNITFTYKNKSYSIDRKFIKHIHYFNK